MDVPLRTLLLLMLLAAAHVLGAAAQEPQELLQNTWQQDSSTDAQQQYRVVITGPTYTLENNTITLNVNPMSDSGSDELKESCWMVLTISEDNVSSTQLYNLTQLYSMGTKSITLPHKRMTPGVTLFEAHLYVGASKTPVVTNSTTISWLMAPNVMASPATLGSDQQARVTVASLVHPPGSPVAGQPIVGIPVRFEMISVEGSLEPATIVAGEPIRRQQRAASASLTVLSDLDGQAVARLLNPTGALGQTAVGVVFEFGPGAGNVHLGKMTSVTWTAPGAGIAVIGPEFTLAGTNISLTFQPIGALASSAAAQAKQAGQLVIAIMDDSQPVSDVRAFDIADLSAPTSIVLSHQKLEPGTVYFYASLAKATGLGSFQDIATNGTAVHFMAKPNIMVSPATPYANGSATITVSPFLYPPGSNSPGVPVPHVPVRFSVVSGEGSFQAIESGDKAQQGPGTAASTLLVLSDFQGKAEAKLTNPSGAVGTANTSISFEFGHGVGNVDVGLTAAVSWTEPPGRFSQILLTPAKSRHQVRSIAKMTAAVRDSHGVPIPGIRVNFLINCDCRILPDAHRVAVTDEDGQATVHFQSANGGTAFVVASTEKSDGVVVMSSTSTVLFTGL